MLSKFIWYLAKWKCQEQIANERAVPVYPVPQGDTILIIKGYLTTLFLERVVHAIKKLGLDVETRPKRAVERYASSLEAARAAALKIVQGVPRPRH